MNSMLILIQKLITQVQCVIRYPFKTKLLIYRPRISTLFIITNTKDANIHLEGYRISNEDLLTKLTSSPNVSLNSKQLYIPSEFTHFNQVLNKIVCDNILPSKHSSEVGYVHAKIYIVLEKELPSM